MRSSVAAGEGAAEGPSASCISENLRVRAGGVPPPPVRPHRRDSGGWQSPDTAPSALLQSPGEQASQQTARASVSSPRGGNQMKTLPFRGLQRRQLAVIMAGMLVFAGF